MPLAGAAQRLGKDRDLDRALAAVRLRCCADSDEDARLDVRQRCLRDPVYRRILGESHLDVTRLTGLDRQQRAINRLDRATDPYCLLRKRG